MAYVTAAVLAAVSVIAALFTSGDACNNVASMTWTTACRHTNRWEKLCRQTLQPTAPDTAKVTVYALIATRLARLRYESAMGEVDRLLQQSSPGGNAPAEARVALDNCKVKYGASRRFISAVENQLFACDFSQARQGYIDAEVGVRSCLDGLLRLPNQYQSWPLFSMVSNDHELTMVAYLLGAIFLGR